MSEETAFISFFLQEAQYYCKNIYKFLFFFKCMHKLCEIYLHEIFCRGKISRFSTEGKKVFSSFSKRYFIFLPFQKGYNNNY